MWKRDGVSGQSSLQNLNHHRYMQSDVLIRLFCGSSVCEIEWESPVKMFCLRFLISLLLREPTYRYSDFKRYLTYGDLAIVGSLYVDELGEMHPRAVRMSVE